MRVLYVDVDSMRPDHLGCYGYHRDTSPTVDGIAEGGVRFTNYYAADVPCLPSRTALFSGRFGVHTGVVNHSGVNADLRRRGTRRNEDTRGEYASLPARLDAAGYRTASISPFPQRHGAWHVVDGFGRWIDTGGGGTERADEVAPHALEWLEAHATEDDWFLHLNFWDPHTPYDTPAEYGDPFADEPAPAFPDADTVAAQRERRGPHSARDLHHSYLDDGAAPSLERTPDEIGDRADYERWVNGYDTGVRYMDDHLATVIDALREAGVYEDTLVVVSADHGENQGELNVYGDHQLADHWTCRVPLIVSGPGAGEGVDDGLRYNVDFAPTLCDLLGIDPAPRWDGRSFAGAVETGGHADDGREFLVTGQGTWACQRGVRWEDWLLLCTYHDGYKAFDAVELYDLAEDPHETTDRSGERPAVVREGMALLQRWLVERCQEVAADRAGGNPDATDALVDPLFQVIEDGGPCYLRGKRESYAERLRSTGREAAAELVLERDGLVEQDDPALPP